jgi:hypothetical protein
VESLQVGIRARRSRVRAPATHSYSATCISHLTVLAQTGRPSSPVCGWALTGRQEGKCWNSLRGFHPLPYHLGFMVGLASGVPPSVLDQSNVSSGVNRQQVNHRGLDRCDTRKLGIFLLNLNG